MAEVVTASVPAQIVAKLIAVGAYLETTDDGRMCLHAPPGAVSGALKDEVRSHRLALLLWLKTPVARLSDADLAELDCLPSVRDV